MIAKNLNINNMLEKLELLKQKGYTHFDLELSDQVSDPDKYLGTITFYPLERSKKGTKKPNRKLKIEELIKYES